MIVEIGRIADGHHGDGLAVVAVSTIEQKSAACTAGLLPESSRVSPIRRGEEDRSCIENSSEDREK